MCTSTHVLIKSRGEQQLFGYYHRHTTILRPNKRKCDFMRLILYYWYANTLCVHAVDIQFVEMFVAPDQ